MRFALIFFALLLAAGTSSAQESQDKTKRDYYREFQQVFEFVDRDYVDEPDKQKMVDHSIRGMLEALDPHSQYFTDEDLKDFIDNTNGEFGGIGVQLIRENNDIKVISPIDGLPADDAGIKAGDYILAVDEEPVYKLGFIKAAKAIRGKPGSTVKLTVLTEGDNYARELSLKRSIVKIEPVKSRMDENGVAYIRISTFDTKTFSSLQNNIKKIKKAGAGNLKGIILDLRNNPGGPFDQALLVSSYFLKDGVVVKTKGRSGIISKVEHVKDMDDKMLDLPIIVLINKGSASASEIVAAALQDHGRAIILGTKSYGKGSIQAFFEFTNRSGAKITVAKYYTGSGKAIDKEGVTPDVEVHIPESIKYASDEKKSKFGDKFLKVEDKKAQKQKSKNNRKINELPDFQDHYENDFQFARGFDLMKGLILTKDREGR